MPNGTAEHDFSQLRRAIDLFRAEASSKRPKFPPEIKKRVCEVTAAAGRVKAAAALGISESAVARWHSEANGVGRKKPAKRAKLGEKGKKSKVTFVSIRPAKRLEAATSALPGKAAAAPRSVTEDPTVISVTLPSGLTVTLKNGEGTAPSVSYLLELAHGLADLCYS